MSFKLDSHIRWLILLTFTILLLAILHPGHYQSINQDEQTIIPDVKAVEVQIEPTLFQLEQTTANKAAEVLIEQKGKVVLASAEQETSEAHAIQAMAEKYEVVEVTATGYFAGRESTGKEPGHPQYGITFSGLKVLRDSSTISTIAADLEVFPLGTVLFIPGYGYGLVADTGSAIKGNIIDLYFDTIEDVYDEWGKKKLEVFVIEHGEGRITEDMFSDKIAAYKN